MKNPYDLLYYSILSGCLGATASCFAKLAFDTTFGEEQQALAFHINSMLCTATISSSSSSSPPPPPSTTDTWYPLLWNDQNMVCEWLILILYRGICLTGMILCNIYMIGTFLKGIDESGTIAGTALSTSSNFILSAMYGYYVWKERFGIDWYVGFSMVCFGMIVLTQFTSNGHDTTASGNSNTDTSNDHVKME